ncbi:hypothetical protein [Pelagerythrobacter rhizovicinus]|uniref:hypothetical protein n=1 Tax=Pelagerythrobacter rhizovicinus TaxID=2268576 RepID=UPI0013EE34A6|nr:hypothetical protein [Pelagerythrobacter rhizovicinus]
MKAARFRGRREFARCEPVARLQNLALHKFRLTEIGRHILPRSSLLHHPAQHDLGGQPVATFQRGTCGIEGRKLGVPPPARAECQRREASHRHAKKGVRSGGHTA